MNFPEARAYLESLVNYEKIPSRPYAGELKLERFLEFLPRIGNPHQRLSCIHVAGSKGKGSTCVFIASILSAAGFKTGLYTSPHLSDVRERIRILHGLPSAQRGAPAVFSGMISRRGLARVVEQLRPSIEKYSRSCAYGPLSFFEVYTAMAFRYFEEAKTDFVVLETGLGGRCDATNVVQPLVSVITPISYEHTDKLGATLAQIASEKAGIIKHGNVPVVCAPQPKEALNVIRAQCRLLKAPLYQVGRDITCARDANRVSIHALRVRYQGLRILLPGAHQVDNAMAAVGAVELLRRSGVAVGAKAVRQGLAHAVWPARCEIISRAPWVMLDGAQNRASFRVLGKAVQTLFPGKKVIMVLGMSSDKDRPGICREASRFADEIILTRSANPRAVLPEALLQYFDKKQAVLLTANVPAARAAAFARAKRDDVILVCGSLFVAGEFRDESL